MNTLLLISPDIFSILLVLAAYKFYHVDVTSVRGILLAFAFCTLRIFLAIDPYDLNIVS